MIYLHDYNIPFVYKNNDKKQDRARTPIMHRELDPVAPCVQDEQGSIASKVFCFVLFWLVVGQTGMP